MRSHFLRPLTIVAVALLPARQPADAQAAFLPGDRPIFETDFSDEQPVGFPRRLAYREGTMDLVQAGTSRYVRATSRSGFTIPLPEMLPERFTIEIDVINPAEGDGEVFELQGGAPASRSRPGTIVLWGADGVGAVGGGVAHAMLANPARNAQFRGRPARLRVQGDPTVLKVYLDDQLMADVPGANFERGTALSVTLTGQSPAAPAYVGRIRVAGFGAAPPAAVPGGPVAVISPAPSPVPPGGYQPNDPYYTPGAPPGPPPPAATDPYPPPAYLPPAYPAPAQPAPGYPPAQSGYVPPAAPPPPAAQPAAAPAAGEVRSGKQFLDKITGHAKKKSGDVAAETATNVANAANDVVDTSLVAGKDMVSNNTRAVTTSVGREVRGIGQSLTAGGDAAVMEDPPDLSKALKQGRVVLRQIRFFEGSASLDPVSNSLVTLLAQAIAANPGNYLLEVHVDPGFDPSQAQALAETRAAVLKQSLTAAGVPGDRVAAVGLGATKPNPKPLGPGGVPTSARVEISRL